MRSEARRPSAKRPVPGWPRRWVVLLRLHDYLLFDAPELFRLWARSRDDFWQYVMRVEGSRQALGRKPGGAVPKRGAWRID